MRVRCCNARAMPRPGVGAPAPPACGCRVRLDAATAIHGLKLEDRAEGFDSERLFADERKDSPIRYSTEVTVPGFGLAKQVQNLGKSRKEAIHSSTARGMLFYRFVQQAAQIGPAPSAELVASCDSSPHHKM